MNPRRQQQDDRTRSDTLRGGCCSRASVRLFAVASTLMLLCLAGCGQKKRNANHDIEKNKSSLMDQMDKIAAQEDAKQAEAKKEDSGDVAPASTPSEPAKPEPPASPKPSEKPPA